VRHIIKLLKDIYEHIINSLDFHFYYSNYSVEIHGIYETQEPQLKEGMHIMLQRGNAFFSIESYF